MKKKRILITGGAGFIGSNLVNHFLSLGMNVVVLDNLSTGYEKNISIHFNNNDFKFINGDIRKYDDCKIAVENCDFVLHHAALGSVARSIDDPITTNDVNVNGFLNVLKSSRDASVKRFIYAASSSTYGDIESDFKVENNIGKPLSNYAVTKYVNELYADVFSSCYEMECIGLRYFNVFGPNQDPHGSYAAVIPIWIKDLLNHKSPCINGDGDISRDFTYVDNVISANQKALLLDSKLLNNNKKFFSEIFNIGCGSTTSLFDLFNYIREILSTLDSKILDIEAVYGPPRLGDVKFSKASIKKAYKLLKYSPHHDIYSGLKETCNFYWNEENK